MVHGQMDICMTLPTHIPWLTRVPLSLSLVLGPQTRSLLAPGATQSVTAAKNKVGNVM